MINSNVQEQVKKVNKLHKWEIQWNEALGLNFTYLTILQSLDYTYMIPMYSMLLDPVVHFMLIP